MAERYLLLERALLDDGWAGNVFLELDSDGVIEALSVGVADGHGGAERVDGTVIPGMPNAHSHGFQHLMAGLTGACSGEADSFWGWREAMYRLAAKIRPGDFEVALAWVYLEMLRAGFTSCAEFHYLHHQPDGHPYSDPAEMCNRVVAAAQTAGMPLTLLPVLYCRSGFGSATVEDRQRRFHLDADGYLRLLESCRRLLNSGCFRVLGIAPHSLRAVPMATLDAVLAAAPGDAPRHIHIAEQRDEVAACIAHHGASPVWRLLNELAVDGRWCLVHATHMADDERVTAAATGAVAGLCPITEADLGDGMFKAGEWVHEGGRFAIGSDSNVQITVTGELRQLEYGERLRTGRRNVLGASNYPCGQFIYTHAAAGGGRAIGQPVGALAPGCRADLLVLDSSHRLLAGRSPEAMMDTWIFAGEAAMLKSVWVAGRKLVDGGRHPEQERLENDFRLVMKRLLES